MLTSTLILHCILYGRIGKDHRFHSSVLLLGIRHFLFISFILIIPIFLIIKCGVAELTPAGPKSQYQYNDNQHKERKYCNSRIQHEKSHVYISLSLLCNSRYSCDDVNGCLDIDGATSISCL